MLPSYISFLIASMTITGAFVDLPGVRMWYLDTEGDGTPLVLMHAGTGTSESWRPNISAFANAGYRVIAFDRRGSGKSVADPSTGAQPGSASADLDALMVVLAISKFHLVAVAAGAFEALDYASWKSETLLSLVAAASTGSIQEPDIIEFSARIRIAALQDPNPAANREISASYRGANPDGTAAWIAIEHQARQAGTTSQPRRTPNTYAKLAAITAPTLVLAGGADLIAPPPLMALWAAHVKNAEFATISMAGHSISWENPDEFNDYVIAFLGKRQIGGGSDGIASRKASRSAG
jgi:pimeloyl-ACP methyl ester carboxylesterase